MKQERSKTDETCNRCGLHKRDAHYEGCWVAGKEYPTHDFDKKHGKEKKNQRLVIEK